MKLILFLTLTLLATEVFASAISTSSTEVRYDSRNRPVIATHVNEQGPYYMVVDTGAEVTLIKPELAKLLKLNSFDTGLTINGSTGAITAKAFAVDKFTSELFDVSYVGLLLLPNQGSTEAAGIIGMDLFADKALVFDSSGHTMRVVPSGKVEGDYTIVPAIKDGGLLLHVNVMMNGVNIPALIDTGAAGTIANASALKALGWKETDPHLVSDGSMLGATRDLRQVKKATVETISLGEITMRDVPVRFTTVIDDEPPSIILGTDVLNSLIGFAIDFPRREFLIQLPKKS